ncbi:MAG: hypothetical protein ACE5K7_03875 [Phycisphaerae bacterium]
MSWLRAAAVGAALMGIVGIMAGCQRGGASSETAGRSSTSQPVEPEPNATPQAVVRLFLEAIEQEVAAAQLGRAGRERVRQARAALERLVAGEAIFQRFKDVLGERIEHVGLSLETAVGEVVDSWAPALAHYAGRWELEKMTTVSAESGRECTAYVPATGRDDPNDRAIIAVELVRGASGSWRVRGVQLRAGASGMASLRPTTRRHGRPPEMRAGPAAKTQSVRSSSQPGG